MTNADTESESFVDGRQRSGPVFAAAQVPVQACSVERASSMQVGRFAVMRYVLVKYGEGKCAVLLPVKEEEFIRLLEERRG